MDAFNVTRGERLPPVPANATALLSRYLLEHLFINHEVRCTRDPRVRQLALAVVALVPRTALEIERSAR